MGATRTIRHLHLAAPGEAAVRRLLPTLEDALRCASLGDEGPRLKVVRRLALGRVAADISAQALARLIEERTAQAAVAWVEAQSADAAAAPCVVFASALQARTQLALRLLRRQACDAWYWPLAVPEFVARDAPALNLRRIACAVAATPEARAALPAWAGAIAREVGAQPLAACITAAEGEALLQRAGIALPGMRGQRDAPRPQPSAGKRSDARGSRMGRHPASVRPAAAAAVPAWLQALCGEMIGANSPRQSMTVPARPLHAGGPTDPRTSLHDAATAASAQAIAQGLAPVEDSTSRSANAAAPLRPMIRALPAAPRAPLAPQEDDRALAPRAIAAQASDTEGQAWLQPTAFGGLLFLLPLLQRLGLPAWLPPEDSGFAALVLRAALQRLQASEEDPAWLLAAAGSPAPPYPLAAPEAWQDPLLAVLRAGPGLDYRLQHAAGAAEQAQVWLAAARYWLRRAGRIGLASLVRRPARLALTATHADLHFDLAHTDLRVRRLGLDFDPGWLPWYGRVVSFHYEVRA